jgi:GDP-mannose 6-dehydrogenase
MKVGLIGFGYIGTVCAAGISEICENIIVYDSNAEKLKSIENGTVRFSETAVEEIINKNKTISTVSQIKEFSFSTIDCFLIAVNTDFDEKIQSLDISNVIDTLRALHNYGYQGTVILRSTLPLGPDYTSIFSNFCFKIEFVPEFLREGTSLSDFRNTEILVIGANYDLENDDSFAKRLFGSFSKDLQITNIETAVYAKLLNNAFHSVKISFANEANRVSQYASGVDASIALDILCRDRKLNISDAYMRPGGPFGGPCLIKDLKSLKTLDPTSGLFEYIENINSAHIEHLAISLIGILEEIGAETFNFDTYEFKSNTGDDRSSIARYVTEMVEKISSSYKESKNDADCIFCGRSLMDRGLVVRV